MRFGRLKNWLKAKNNEQIKNVFKEITKATESIRKEVKIQDSHLPKKIQITKNIQQQNLLCLYHLIQDCAMPLTPNTINLYSKKI